MKRKAPRRRGGSRVVDAEGAVIGHLSAYPAAQELARSVLGFYGASLKYSEDLAVKSSQNQVNLDRFPLRFREAILELHMGAGQTAEALAHELLHLRQPILGFPRIAKIETPPEVDSGLDHVLHECQRGMFNVVDHEIFIDAFVALGFERTRFLNKNASRVDHEAAAKAGAIFPWWCYEVHRHWASRGQVLDEDLLAESDKALHWGSRLYPDLEAATRQMREWTERGDFSSSGSYVRAFTELLGIMRLPAKNEWYVLRASPGGPPIAEWLPAK